MLMINNTARSLAQGQDTMNQKIPSLFELNLSAPTEKNDEKDEKGNFLKTEFICIRYSWTNILISVFIKTGFSYVSIPILK